MIRTHCRRDDIALTRRLAGGMVGGNMSKEEQRPMRYFGHFTRQYRRLPPLLRVASVLGLVFALTSLLVFVVSLVVFIASWAASSPPSMESYRQTEIAVNLGILGGACTFTVNAYSARFRPGAREPFLLDGWRRQARSILMLAALPLCAITLAIVISPDSIVFVLTFAVSVFGAGTLLVAYFWLLIKTRISLTELPPA